MPQERLSGRFQETLRIWRAAMAGSDVDVSGEFRGAVRGRLGPAPAQGIWVSDLARGQPLARR